MFGKLLSNKFNQNVAVLLIGTVLSQAIPIAVAPILTRLFTPDDFGLFALYFSLSMILSVIVTGRYEMAIMLPKEEKDAIGITKMAMVITTVISIILFILFFFLKNQIAFWLNNPKIENWLLMLPFTVFIIGIYQSLNYLNTRHERFKMLALSRFTRSANTSGFSLLAGFLKLNNTGLIIGDTIGQGIATIILYFRSLKFFGKHKLNNSALLELGKQYKHFPMFNVPSGLLEKSSGQVPVILLTVFFGNAFVGLFTLSQRVISAPGSIVARAFGDVFRQQATKEFKQNGSCTILFIKTIKNLFYISLLPFTILLFFSPLLFEIIFGKEWRSAGEYAQIMTPMFFLQFVVSPLSNMFYVAEKQKTDLVIQCFLFISLCSALAIGFYVFHSSFTAIVLFTIIYCIKYFVELILAYKYSLGKHA